MSVGLIAHIAVATLVHRLGLCVAVTLGLHVAETVFDRELQTTSSSPALVFLTVCDSVSDNAVGVGVHLPGVEDVATVDGEGPVAHGFAESGVNVPSSLTRALGCQLAGIVASCGLKADVPGETHVCHAADVPCERVLRLAAHGDGEAVVVEVKAPG